MGESTNNNIEKNTMNNQNITASELQINQQKNTNSTAQQIQQNLSVQNQQKTILPQQNIENNQEQLHLNVSKKSNKKEKVLILLIILIILFGGFLTFYVFYIANGKRIIKTNINTLFTTINDKIDILDQNTLKYDLETEAIGLEGNLSISSNYKDESIDLTKLKNYNLNYIGVIDKKNNKLSGEAFLTKENNPLLSLNGYLNGKELLIKSEQLFENILKTTTDTELKELETTKTLNYENIKTLINKTQEITIKNLKKEKIIRTTEKKKFNDKEEDVIKVSYTFDSNAYNAALLNGYLEDDEVLNILSELYNSDKDKIKKLLQNQLDILEKNDSEQDKYILDIYVNMIGLLKEIDISKEEKIYNDEITTTKLIIINDKNKYNLYIKNDEEIVLSGLYDSSLNILTIIQKTEDTDIKITMKQINKNKYNINITYSSNDANSLSIDTSLENTINSTSQTTDITTSLNYKTKEKNIEGTIKSITKISKGKTVNIIEGNNIKNTEELTEEETSKIYEKLIEIMQSIINDIAPNNNNNSETTSI